ncbi:hypothetical protein, partial [Staphylococcus aureus]|uniref:hypothetical protein n=1 Tax=Staphylococcus aureus TaxID=1280 RepID=UPI0021B113C5
CWTAQQLARYPGDELGLRRKETRLLQQQAMDKMELALLWASGESAALAGKTRRFPTGNEVQKLKMDEWEMGSRLMSAQQY